MPNDSNDDRWHEKTIPTSLVSVIVSLALAFITVRQFLVDPLDKDRVRLETQLTELKMEVARGHAANDLRWTNMPNVTSLQGRIDSLDERLRASVQFVSSHDALIGHSGVLARVAELRELINTEAVERKAVDAASLAMRMEAMERLRRVEAQVTKLRERAARMETFHPPYSLHAPRLQPEAAE